MISCAEFILCPKLATQLACMTVAGVGIWQCGSGGLVAAVGRPRTGSATAWTGPGPCLLRQLAGAGGGGSPRRGAEAGRRCVAELVVGNYIFGNLHLPNIAGMPPFWVP